MAYKILGGKADGLVRATLYAAICAHEQAEGTTQTFTSDTRQAGDSKRIFLYPTDEALMADTAFDGVCVEFDTD